MRLRRALLPIGLAAVFAWTAAAGVVDINFDNTFDSTLTPPFVGSGTFSFSIDPGDGTNPLSAFGVYNFLFTFGPSVFTTADITTTLSDVRVILSTPGLRQAQFSNVLLIGDGCCRGSLDFMNGSGDQLSFEPPGFGGNLTRYFVEGQNSYLGTYATVTPEPSAGILMLAGLFALAAWRARSVYLPFLCKGPSSSRTAN